MGYKTVTEAFWELVFPPISDCILCKSPLLGQVPFHICPACHGKLSYIPRGRWLMASLYGQASMRMFSVLHYSGPVIRLIYRFKYHHETYLARILGRMLAAFAIREPLAFDLICPVPLYRKREKQRGFNQSALLAKYMAAEGDWEYDVDQLIRVRETAAMHQLTKYERSQNVKDAFSLRDPEKVAGKDILLVDDILTTGATAEACGNVIMSGGARSVTLLTLAYRPKSNP